MRRLCAIVLICVPLLAATALYAQTPVPQDTAEVEITARELADKLVEYAETFLGTPYRYGANGPKRFDCTGYTRYVFGHFGFHDLSRSAKDQARDGREVDISDFRNLQKGDVLLLGSRRNPKVVGHVGIFTGLDTARNDPKFIHASNHGVRHSSIYTESYYANRLLGARRFLPDFEDYDVVFDSTAVYAFDTELGVHIAPDSLVLADNDRRIVLFENGKWAFVEEDGTLVVPGQGGRIILSGDGNWAPVREATVHVPGSSLRPEPKETVSEKPAPAKPAVSPAAADTSVTATAQPQQPEKVYYTIKKGDSLSKIAKQHHTTVNKLCQLNGMTTKTILKVGKKIRVK